MVAFLVSMHAANQASAINVEIIRVLFKQIGLLCDFQLPLPQQIDHFSILSLKVDHLILSLFDEFHAEDYFT